MPKIQFEAASKHPAPETFQRIKSFLENDKDLKRMDSHYQCEFDDANLTATATGSQFKAGMNVKPNGESSSVVISVELPFALALFKGKIQQMLQSKLDKTLV